MYFNKLGKTLDTIPLIDAQGKETNKSYQKLNTNIHHRVILKNAQFLDNRYTDLYTQIDGDKPEIVSHKLYGTTNYHWTVLLVNNRISLYEWFKSSKELDNYVRKKYENPFAIHHYEDGNGFIVEDTTPGALPVDNYEYEIGVNEGKRVIEVVKTKFISQFIVQFQNVLTGKIR